MRSNLQRLELYTAEDFGISEEQFQVLMALQKEGTDVNIDCFVAEGEFGYFDITLPNGIMIEAIDGYHLTAICALKKMYKS